MSKQGFRAFIFQSLLQTILVVHAMAQDQAQRSAFPSPADSFIQANKNILQLWKQGYLFAQIYINQDSITQIYKGEKHPFSVRSINDSVSGEIQKPFTFFQNQLNYWGNHGYPFCELSLSDIQQNQTDFTANLNIQKGPYIEFDTIIFTQKIRTDSKFIERTLEIERYTPYSELSYRAIEERISRIPFMEMAESKDISFQNGKSSVYLHLKELSSSTFEGVLSVLPNQVNSGVLLTGFINLQLENLFFSGKSLAIEWNRFDVQSQSLNLNYQHPYVAGTRLLAGFDFSFLKQDTSFISRNFEINVGTYLTSRGVLDFEYNRASGNLIDSDSAAWQQTGALDYERRLYGLSFNVGRYAQALGYGSQYKLFTSLAFGEKKIIDSPSGGFLQNDSLQTKSGVVILDLKLKFQRVLKGQTVLFNQLEMGRIFNDQVFANEAYRLGGLRTIRGFNEQSIYSSQYALSRLELRQYFESQSYFMIFYDQMYTKYTADEDWPFGLGTGFSLSSNRSLFNFAMAVGKSKDNSLDLSNIKIHFGYVSKF